jgi:hypothetical protein
MNYPQVQLVLHHDQTIYISENADQKSCNFCILNSSKLNHDPDQNLARNPSYI